MVVDFGACRPHEVELDRRQLISTQADVLAKAAATLANTAMHVILGVLRHVKHFFSFFLETAKKENPGKWKYSTKGAVLPNRTSCLAACLFFSCSLVDTAATFPQTWTSIQEQSTHPHTPTHTHKYQSEGPQCAEDRFRWGRTAELVQTGTLVQSKQSRPFQGLLPASPACCRHKMVKFCCVTSAATRSLVGLLVDEHESHSALLAT